MSHPTDLQVLRLLKAFDKVEDPKGREIIVMLAEAGARGEGVTAKAFRRSITAKQLPEENRTRRGRLPRASAPASPLSSNANSPGSEARGR